MGAGLALPEMGKSFAVMSYGDLAARCAPPALPGAGHRHPASSHVALGWRRARKGRPPPALPLRQQPAAGTRRAR